MSFFPAYEDRDTPAERSTIEGIRADQSGISWLMNSSFEACFDPLFHVSATLNKETTDVLSLDADWTCAKFKDNLKYEKKLNRPGVRYIPELKNTYHEDKRANFSHINYGVLPTKSRPEYYYKPCYLGCNIYEFVPLKKEALIRYHDSKLNPSVNIKRLRVLFDNKTSKTMNGFEENLLQLAMNVQNVTEPEEEQTLLMREFNRYLSESPHDVERWIRFIEIQDIVRVLGESVFNLNQTDLIRKKLSIVDEAIEKNPDSVDLHRVKVYLMSKLYPAEDLLVRFGALLRENGCHPVYMLAFIMVVQCSVSMSTVPKILLMYSQCYKMMQARLLKNEPKLDETILGMLFQYLVFLRQAGLWEQMWETLRLNLNCNICPALKLESTIKESDLINFEEVIFSSGLPLNQLWLRVELLREKSHWIRVERDDLEMIGDPDRYKLNPNIGDFVYPTMRSPGLRFRLAIYALLSLKVPLLPTYHSILEDLGLDKCCWTIDSIESLLPMFYPAVGELSGHKHRNLMLDGLLVGDLTSGPQYLRYHPSQEPYHDFIRCVFSGIADSLPSAEKTCLYIWWMRFERMLLKVSKNEMKSDQRRKKLSQILKEFFRQEDNRYNLLYYREWALIQRDMGCYDVCLNILAKVIEGASIETEENRTAVLSLQRTRLEVMLSEKNYDGSQKSRVKEILCQLVPGDPQNNDIALAEAYLRDRLEEYLRNPPSKTDDYMNTYFLPNPVCDTMACYAYLLYVDDRNVCEILERFDDCYRWASSVNYLQERFYVNEIVILEAMNERLWSMNGIFVQRLNDALKLYPDNFYLLSVLAGIETQLPSWKLMTRMKMDRPWLALAYCLSGRARINTFARDTVTHAMTAAVTKLVHFHRKIGRTPDMQHCPLIWRLLMLLLREHNLSEQMGEKTYHESVAQCPWARSIYIDAAEVAPQLLTQIQNVIREKELRMHISPEELNILRGS